MTQNTVVAGLKELSSKVTEAKSTRIKAETAYQQVLDLQPNVKALLALPVVAADPTVINLQANLAKAENDFAALRQRYKEKHPKYVQAQSQINAIQSDLTNAIRNSAATLKTALDSARAAESALNDAFRAQEASALELNKLAIQYGVLNREVDSDRALYESILNRMKETSITKELKHSLIRLTQPAFIPEQPLPAKRGIILALSGMAGLFFGAMLALGLQSLDSSIKTIDHAESLLRLPVLSAISHMREVRRGKSPLVVLEASNSIGAEAFRTLRTTLSMLSRVEECRVFLLTSALPQEGKTFCSLNYAASLAQLGLNTLLIDADLRRPAVESSLLGKRSSCPGVADYLLGQKRLDEIVQPTSLEKFLFIPAGTTAPNPAELLAKDGLSTLINEALKHYDRVVIDSAPIHAVSDTLLMLKNVQTVCLVVRAARTSSRSVLRCVQILQGAQAPLCGIVLNRMPVRRGLSPDNCYYDYSYHGKYSKSGIYGAKS
jgi:capsular exopolysaccharide synthesis family protein